jgi:hypothetical protein
MIATKINSNKKFSLLVYCLIIGGLFFTNVNNNVLGVESKSVVKELTEDERTKLVNFVITNMSVDDKEKEKVKSNIKKWCNEQGCGLNKDDNLVNRDGLYVLLPCFIDSQGKTQIVPENIYDTIEKETKEYPKGCIIGFPYIGLGCNGEKFSIYPDSINAKKDLVHTHACLKATGFDLCNIYIAKVREAKAWKTQLINVDTNKKIDVNPDVQEEMEKSFNNLLKQSMKVYSNDIKYINPFAITEEKKKKLMMVFEKNLDNYDLVKEVVDQYVQNRITNKDWFIDWNGKLINKDSKTLLVPVNEQSKICNSENNQRKIIFNRIEKNSLFAWYNIQNILDSTEKNLQDIKETIEKLNTEQNDRKIKDFYLIKKNHQYQLDLLDASLNSISSPITINTQQLNTILELYKYEIFDVCEEWKLDDKIKKELEEQKRLAEEERIETEKRLAEEKRMKHEEQQRIKTEKRLKALEDKRIQNEEQQRIETQKALEEQKRLAEEKRKKELERQKEREEWEKQDAEDKRIEEEQIRQEEEKTRQAAKETAESIAREQKFQAYRTQAAKALEELKIRRDKRIKEEEQQRKALEDKIKKELEEKQRIKDEEKIKEAEDKIKQQPSITKIHVSNQPGNQQEIETNKNVYEPPKSELEDGKTISVHYEVSSKITDEKKKIESDIKQKVNEYPLNTTNSYGTGQIYNDPQGIASPNVYVAPNSTIKIQKRKQSDINNNGDINPNIYQQQIIQNIHIQQNIQHIHNNPQVLPSNSIEEGQIDDPFKKEINQKAESNNVVIGGIIVTVGIVGTGILGLYYKEKQKDKNKKAIIKNELKEEEIIEELNKNNQKEIKPIKKNNNKKKNI